MTDISLQMNGHVLIRDIDTQMVLADRSNAINFEVASYALALSLAHRSNGNITQVVFGNGASSVSAVGGVTYLPPNVTGVDAQLYNQTYSKFVDDLSPLNTDPINNFLRVNHITGNTYSDVVVTTLLDYNEPAGQLATDATDNEGAFVFDEIGIKTYDSSNTTGFMLSHVIFHPVQKSMNRRIEVIYTFRIVLS
jgi:hypothetical protein